jgi:hypothetical protein
MEHGSTAIGLEEFILRRIHKSHAEPKQAIPILPVGFRATKIDTAGLSVYPQRFVTAPEVDAAGRKPEEYYVVSLSVKALFSLKLTVLPDEQQGGISGHALIPELSFSAYQENKEGLKDVQVEWHASPVKPSCCIRDYNLDSLGRLGRLCDSAHRTLVAGLLLSRRSWCIG